MSKDFESIVVARQDSQSIAKDEQDDLFPHGTVRLGRRKCRSSATSRSSALAMRESNTTQTRMANAAMSYLSPPRPLTRTTL